MAARKVGPLVGFIVGVSLWHAAGCGTITPPWRTSAVAASKPPDEAGLDLAKLPTGLRVALESGMFRDDNGNAIDVTEDKGSLDGHSPALPRPTKQAGSF
ncbi:MAG TPA: hypothetical protein VMV69_27215 [Pirellulales bacterium]|nr:hypothetical protein [Pirellulales bacterium]